MISVLFLCLAIASKITESWLRKPHRFIIDVIDREIAHEKEGAKGWASATTYLFKMVNAHFYFEIAGFLVAAFAAVLEYLLSIGWH
jgi:hypothetical protein